MKSFMRKALTVCLLIVAHGNAQVVQFQPGTPTALNSVDTGFAPIPAGSSPTLLPFTVDPSPNGGDLFDVYVGNPQVNISLVLPSSVEVNANNAASMGFVYVTAQITAPGKLDLSIIGRVGNHVFITLPPAQSAGTYTVKADASAISADTAMNVAYLATSAVRAGLSPNSPLYRLGDTVVLSGVLLEDAAPITNAVATVNVWPTLHLQSQATVTNYRLVSQQQIDSVTV
jgi:hypothetical protein